MQHKTTSAKAFTLVELLAVMGIIVLMLSMVRPAFDAIAGANSINYAVADIAETLEQGRAYAVSNNTYVFVGFEEVDASVSASASPQVTGAGHYGRVAVAAVASTTGVSNYDPASASVSSPWSGRYNSANLVALAPVHHYENLHLVQLGVPTSGAMDRPAVIDPANSNSNFDQIGNSLCVSATPFSTPLGNSLTGGQYQFTQVIQFDPRGIATIFGGGAVSILSSSKWGSSKHMATRSLHCLLTLTQVRRRPFRLSALPGLSAFIGHDQPRTGQPQCLFAG